MNSKKYKPLFGVILLSILLYFVHKLVFLINDENLNFKDFHFPIEVVYSFFCISSLFIVIVIIAVKNKNIDNVGFTFIFATFIKMALSYALLTPVLNAETPNAGTEKINFFIIFALFLVIETIFTVHILNKKQ